MSKQTVAQQAPTTSPLSQGGILQGKCETCGQHTIAGGECEGCRKKELFLQRHLIDWASTSPQLDSNLQPLQESRFQSNFSRVPIQTDLRIGQPNDKYEKEADRIAEQVMRMPTPKPADRDSMVNQFTRDQIQRSHHPQATSTSLPILSPEVGARIQSLRYGGYSLPDSVRTRFEPRFGQDFSHVQVHTDRTAADLAATLQAQAFTLGNHIAFAAGEFNPGTERGSHLLAHELTHVIQQGGHTGQLQRQCLRGAVCGFPAEGETAEREESTTEEPVRPVTTPIPGAPGGFGVEAGEAREEAREQRQREETESPGQPSGQGRRATYTERFGRAQGLDVDRLHGVFIDLDIRREGGYAWTCRYFREFAEPFTGDPNARCVFIPENRETEAQQFLENPDAETIGGRSRENWHLMMVELLTHEIQHVVFGESRRPDNPAGRCSLTTIVFQQAGSRYDVQHYLSELSAILSEFTVRYRARPPSTLEGMDWWFNRIVRRGGESINGILTNLRCVCDCDEVDEYIRQTVRFTVNSWSEMEHTYLNQALRRQEGLNWPIAPAADSLETLRQELEARLPGRRHRWALTPGYTLGYARAGEQNNLLARLGIDFGIPLDQSRRWMLEIGIHETYIGLSDYQSFLTGVRASVMFTTPGTSTSFRAGAFAELGGAATSFGVGESFRPDVYGQAGVTLGITPLVWSGGRLNLSADILGGSTFGAGESSASPWFGVGLRFGIELFRGGD